MPPRITLDKDPSKRFLMLTQSFLTKRQATYKSQSSDDNFVYSKIETPLNVVIWLYLHQTTRSKILIDKRYGKRHFNMLRSMRVYCMNNSLFFFCQWNQGVIWCSSVCAIKASLGDFCKRIQGVVEFSPASSWLGSCGTVSSRLC